MPRADTPPASRGGSPDESSESSGSESEEVVDPKERRRQLKQALVKTKARKRQTSEALLAYTKFAAWYTRNGQLTMDWQVALEKGIANDNQDYGKLSRNEFKKKYTNEIAAYIDMKEKVRNFDEDLKYIEKHPNALDNLASAMTAAAGTAKSNDVAGLKSRVLDYTALVHENQKLEPKILVTDRKSTTRGFNHPQLARLLCPAKLLENFDQEPDKLRKELASGRQKVRSNDMPGFLWNRGEYDPEDISSNMFRSEVLVMTYRHIYTCPSSATQEPGSTKTKASHAKKNHMKSVTPESIAYSCVQYRHGISSVEDWRTEDRIFNRQDFFKEILEIFLENRASNPEWYYDLIQWWNVRVFGTELDCIDDSENEEGPSTLRAIREQRKAAMAMSQAAAYKLPPPDPNRPPGPESSPPPRRSPRLPTPGPTFAGKSPSRNPHVDNPKDHEGRVENREDDPPEHGRYESQSHRGRRDRLSVPPLSPSFSQSSRDEGFSNYVGQSLRTTQPRNSHDGPDGDHEERRRPSTRPSEDLTRRRPSTRPSEDLTRSSHRGTQPLGLNTRVQHGVRVIYSPEPLDDAFTTESTAGKRRSGDITPFDKRHTHPEEGSPSPKRHRSSHDSENRRPTPEITRSSSSKHHNSMVPPGSVRRSERQARH